MYLVRQGTPGKGVCECHLKKTSRLPQSARGLGWDAFPAEKAVCAKTLWQQTASKGM